MKVQTTKILAKTLRERKPDKFKGYILEYDKISIANYRRNVNCFEDINSIDYDRKNQRFKVFRLTYPYEYYAMPQYITTADLIRIFKKSDRTLQGFVNAFYREYEI